jgi:hypothetical protein
VPKAAVVDGFADKYSNAKRSPRDRFSLAFALRGV